MGNLRSAKNKLARVEEDKERARDKRVAKLQGHRGKPMMVAPQVTTTKLVKPSWEQ